MTDSTREPKLEALVAKLVILIRVAPLKWKQTSWRAVVAKSPHYTLWLNHGRLDVYERGIFKSQHPFLTAQLPEDVYKEIVETLRHTYRHSQNLITELENLANFKA